MARIVIAEDQQMLRGAFTTLIKMEDDLEIVAEVADGEEALRAIQKHNPDICLVDIEMPGLTGLELALKLRTMNHPCKIIIVTTFSRPGYLQQAMKAKVDGYLLKDEPIDFLIQAIRRVMKGEKVISNDLTSILFQNEENPLTERETEMLLLAKEGLTTDEISKKLYLTKGTIRNYLSSAIQKLEAESRQQAVHIASNKGWI
ncbi:response regulator transcription factor [Oceanobacillus sp. Castelsardo]|uniref:response regulator transcription factor n=1 Tax=Oceanobacillus sp. Castelsardo TaxID=1851204 RepID=UPI000838A5C6|nr:response regulator transcription factor [Oceanobacillus sp. Castelsardo]